MNYIGIDISQDYVDADLPGGVQQLAQTAAGHAALLAALPEGAVCVLEATGPYGLRLLAALHQAQQPVCTAAESVRAGLHARPAPPQRSVAHAVASKTGIA